MKKFIISFMFIFLFVSAAFAADAPAEPIYVPAEQGKVPAEQKITEELPQPYETICRQLSNGKEDVMRIMHTTAAEHINEPAFRILEALGAAAASHYAGNPELGVTNFCSGLDVYNTLEEQAVALSAFIRGYNTYGAVIISCRGNDKEPVTRANIIAGKWAWFIPVKIGTSVKFNLYGKSDETVKVWKVLPQRTICKEWKGGFWEREITATAK